jgi:hypothetical protein
MIKSALAIIGVVISSNQVHAATGIGNAIVFSHPNHVHVKHGMILLGESEVIASHIVYKTPHNFQVLMSLKLDQATNSLYLKARADHPKSTFILLLDPIDIEEITSLPSLSGAIFHRDEQGQRHEIAPNVTLRRENFEVLYFDELPLSLAADELQSSLKISASHQRERDCKIVHYKDAKCLMCDGKIVSCQYF